MSNDQDYDTFLEVCEEQHRANRNKTLKDLHIDPKILYLSITDICEMSPENVDPSTVMKDCRSGKLKAFKRVLSLLGGKASWVIHPNDVKGYRGIAE